ncbi:protein-disulfide reductase DsbD [Shewanella salipaludis]|uniref:Thiol:disulfide interchange protein DsbD n=1 Tax=Shewanella salipaludis TaxID=2723052 RepID=A0A972JMW2_9GAMM|nr:protein-disulfide reductase DsbD [Shewanella salipaludis]NMH66922.1 protein-disulfide reductase DsbD [Shewanella salipaludis]
MKNLLNLLLSSLLLLTPLAHGDGIFGAGKNFLGAEPELLPVEQAFDLDFEQQGNRLKLSWVIADGYYMYKDKLKFETHNATLAEIVLPEGSAHEDEYFGEQQVYYTYVDIPLTLQQAADDASLTVTFMGCAEDKLCYPPTKRTLALTRFDPKAAQPAGSGTAGAQAPETQAPESKAGATSVPVTEQDRLNQMLSSGSLWLTLLAFFGLGIGLALTPCVFPMYPILSGIIVGQGQKLSTAKAFGLSMAYVQGMAITYSLLGLVVASAGMKYQAALQHPVVLVLLALLFLVLSLSMFGLYDLKLPSSWQDRLNSAANQQKGGQLLGVFLMGVLSGLVASPCTTAPLSGALIYVAQTGDLQLGFLALYVLSMGMGLPLLIMGTSGGKLLPKAGHWMDVVKTIFGFLLLAVSIVMLGRIWPGLVSDLLWSLWAIVLVGYLMHQNKLSEFNWKQTTRSVLLLLGLLASFSYGLQALMQGLGFDSGRQGLQSQSQQSHGFKRIKSLADLKQELATAAAQGKPVMLDLYADWCVACKEFEAITFKAPQVVQRMDHLVLLQADVTDSDAIDVELLEAFQVLGLPTLLLFDSRGEQRQDLRVTGFMGPDDFATHLDRLLQ